MFGGFEVGGREVGGGFCVAVEVVGGRFEGVSLGYSFGRGYRGMLGDCMLLFRFRG